MSYCQLLTVYKFIQYSLLKDLTTGLYFRLLKCLKVEPDFWNLTLQNTSSRVIYPLQKYANVGSEIVSLRQQKQKEKSWWGKSELSNDTEKTLLIPDQLTLWPLAIY